MKRAPPANLRARCLRCLWRGQLSQLLCLSTYDDVHSNAIPPPELPLSSSVLASRQAAPNYQLWSSSPSRDNPHLRQPLLGHSSQAAHPLPAPQSGAHFYQLAEPHDRLGAERCTFRSSFPLSIGAELTSLSLSFVSFVRQYPITNKTLKPASFPNHYERLRKGIEMAERGEGVKRGWFSWIRWK